MSAGQPEQVTFNFDGEIVVASGGVSVAAALTAAGKVDLRDSRQGDPRGVFCGMGICQECLVVVDGTPAQRACMTAVREGMRVTRAPGVVSLESPAGGRSRGRAERFKAGAPRAVAARVCELLVVGGGPAGLAAAAAAAEAGLDVVLVDERARLGGQYFKQPANPGHPPAWDGQFAAGQALIERVRAAGVEVHGGTSIWGAHGLDALYAVSASGPRRYSCRALILAPGAYERGIPFPGWTLPGVMTTGAAQTLWRSYGVAPGKRVLIAGNGPLNMQVAAELVRGGARVAAVVELAPAPGPARLPALLAMARADPGLIRDGLHYRRVLARAGVPVLYRRLVARAHGEDRVHSAEVAPLDASRQPVAATAVRLEVDAVCLGFGFVPSTELARALGAEHRYANDRACLETVVDECGASSVAGLWVVGDGAAIRGARHAQAQGELAARDALRSMGRGAARSGRRGRAARTAARHRRFQEALARLYAAPNLCEELTEPDTPLCRCEGVSREVVERAIAAGAGHVGTVKRETRAGMGPCQGRYCGPLIARMVARATGEQPGELSGFAPSPPLRPVEIRELL